MIPNNACTLRITAAAGTKLAGASSEIDQTEVFLLPDSSLHPEGLRPTRGVAASDFRPLRIFVAAALRGGPGSVSVPMWRVNLSIPLRVDALVSRYLTNKLIRHRPLQNQPKPLI